MKHTFREESAENCCSNCQIMQFKMELLNAKVRIQLFLAITTDSIYSLLLAISRLPFKKFLRSLDGNNRSQNSREKRISHDVLIFG